MKYPNLIMYVLLGLTLISASLGAETILLKSGSSLTGHILADRESQLIIDIGAAVVVIEKDKILSIEPGSGERGSRKTESAVDDPDRSPAGSTSAVNQLSDSARLYRTARLESRSLQQCYEAVVQAVVKVSTPHGLGSGFFINEKGYLITNYHVIEKETKITVTVFEKGKNGFQKKQLKKVRIVALNPFVDLALLKVEEPGDTEIKYVNLGDMDSIEVGQNVFAIGNPLGLEQSCSEGVITTVSRAFQGLVYIQTNADINPGNSGGPLFDMSGRVIGVTNMGYIFFGGLGFAIPVDYVRHFIENYEAFAYDKDNPNSGFRYTQPPGRKNKNKPAMSR